MKIKLILITSFLIFAISCGQRQSDKFSDNTIKKDTSKIQVEQLKDTAVDMDGNVYHTVKIGEQVWMAENLKVTHYSNGDAIPNVTSTKKWGEFSTGAYCNYFNDPDMGSTFGKLYNWHAVNDKRSISPKGWHVPNYTEWSTLNNYLGGPMVAGGKMKEAGTTHWHDGNLSPATNNVYADNSSSFTALPGGHRDFKGAFNYTGISGFWWSSTEADNNNAWHLSLICNSCEAKTDNYNKEAGFSVRLLKD